ncbi:MAG: hypothetical protein HC913_00340 [Microscillaceae bacterium]|nr:hypothetical protein [Microscillaceae bacterium]
MGNLRPLRTEGQGLSRQFGPDAGTQYDSQYSLIQMAVPLGYGVRFRLSDRLDLSFEMAFRLLFFDHIDDVGGRYPDIRDLESDLARTMYDRSAESVGVLTGDTRTPNAATGFATSLYGIDQGNESILADFPGFTRWASYGLRGQIRGNTPSENDMYIVTGFHLNYILTTKRYPRYKSRF